MVMRVLKISLFSLLIFSFKFPFDRFQNQVPIHEVVIGDQVWMTENLNVSKFRNGDKIEHARSKSEWRKAGDLGKPAWCYYGFDASLGKVYGKLYNWHAVNDERGLAPLGYHVPSQEEWDNLVNSLGGNALAVPALKGTTKWRPGFTGTNSSGFNALPGGYRNAAGIFVFLEEYAKWWTTNSGDAKSAWCFYLSQSSRLTSKFLMNKTYGLSVRCIKDK